MSIDPAALEARIIREQVERALGKRLDDLFKDLVPELRRNIAKARSTRAFSVSVGPQAVQVLFPDPQRIEVIFENNSGSGAIFIGGLKVTTGPLGDPNAGLPIWPNTQVVIDRSVGDWWAVCSGGPYDLRVVDFTFREPGPGAPEE